MSTKAPASRTISGAITVLKKAVNTGAMSADQIASVKQICRQSGTGVSKARMTNKELKEKWLKSAQAKVLERAHPKSKAVAVVAWSVANGKRIRPKKYDDNDAFDDALDYITDNLL